MHPLSRGMSSRHIGGWSGTLLESDKAGWGQPVSGRKYVIQAKIDIGSALHHRRQQGMKLDAAELTMYNGSCPIKSHF